MLTKIQSALCWLFILQWDTAFTTTYFKHFEKMLQKFYEEKFDSNEICTILYSCTLHKNLQRCTIGDTYLTKIYFLKYSSFKKVSLKLYHLKSFILQNLSENCLSIIYHFKLQKFLYFNYCFNISGIIINILLKIYLTNIYITMNKIIDNNINIINYSSLEKYMKPNIEQISHTYIKILLFFVKIHSFFKYFLNNLTLISGCHLILFQKLLSSDILIFYHGS